jgi:hypothetical protein
MLIEALQTYLAADAGLQAQLGTTTSRPDKTTGIFPIAAPSSVPMPYVVCQQVSGEPLQTSMAGAGRLQTSRWRFSCYGTTYKNSKVLARALREALLALYPFSGNGVEIHGAWLKLEADDWDEIPHGTIYGTHLDFDIVYLDLE